MYNNSVIDLKYNLPKIAVSFQKRDERTLNKGKKKKGLYLFRSSLVVLRFAKATPIIASIFRENPGWFRNSAGFWFNSRFGFGLMNAYSLVSASYNWTTVPGKTICKVNVAKG